MLVYINTNIKDFNASISKAKMYLRRKVGWAIPERGSSMNKETEVDLCILRAKVNVAVEQTGSESP